jgi:hypothetical protein
MDKIISRRGGKSEVHIYYLHEVKKGWQAVYNPGRIKGQNLYRVAAIVTGGLQIGSVSIHLDTPVHSQ